MHFRLLAGLCLGITTLSCTRDVTLSESNSTRSDIVIKTRSWAVKTRTLSNAPDLLKVTISAPVEFKDIQVAWENEKPITLQRTNKEPFEVELSFEHVPEGIRKILVAPTGSRNTIASAAVTVSQPLLVVVSTDWDDSRFDDGYIQRMEQLHTNHPTLKVTHFFGPYHFTDPEVREPRKQQLTRWVLEQRKTFGDEIGMHLHGWCHFVETTSVPCRTKESFYRDDGTGYTTILASYSRNEMATILKKGLETFERNNLGRPRSFRSGGWSANAETLKALVDTGFEIDTSAVPPHFIRSWQGHPLYDWLVANWTGIESNSQPYFPDPNAPTRDGGAQALPILEIPDNGALVDYMKEADMVSVLNDNHQEKASLTKPTLFQVGYHPPSFKPAFFRELDAALFSVDKRLASADLGPAIYVNISDLTRIWKRPSQK
jgi:hypothetical protein